MYCRAGQSTEEDMYNNESAGSAFDEFLDLLGERVRLKGWEKYRAQLDNRSEKNANTHHNRNNTLMLYKVYNIRCRCMCKHWWSKAYFGFLPKKNGDVLG